MSSSVNEENKFEKCVHRSIPVIALRGLVVMPDMMLHFDLNREKSIRAAETAMEQNSPIFLVSQKNPGIDSPTVDDIYKMGCIAKVKQMHKRKDGVVSLFVEGLYRGEIVTLAEDGVFLSAMVNRVESIDDFDKDEEREAYCGYIKDLFKKYASYYPKVGNGLIAHFTSIKKAGSLADQVIAGMPINFEKNHEILEILSVSERVEEVAIVLSNEIKRVRRKLFRSRFNLKKRIGKRQKY